MMATKQAMLSKNESRTGVRKVNTMEGRRLVHEFAKGSGHGRSTPHSKASWGTTGLMAVLDPVGDEI